MMSKVFVEKTSNPDKGYSDKNKLFLDMETHRKDVFLVMRTLAEYLESRGLEHDWTKKEFFDEFAKDTLERIDVQDFKARDWYKIHTEYERHHVNANVPSDVNFFDLIEMMVDCIVAGKTRSGTVDYTFLVLNDNILEDAYWNTVELINSIVEVR